MGLFGPAEEASAYLKMALTGGAGTGKTFTGTMVAIGLAKHLQKLGLDVGKKPIYFLDTEGGASWIKNDVESAGLKIMVAKTRAFSDLTAAVKEAEKEASILLIDSITHFWVEFTETYQTKKAKERNRNTIRLDFQDWAYLKGEWRKKFTDPFISSALHIIMCGRMAYEYDYIEDEKGKKNLEKTGVKLKAEGDLGYEPSLVVQMERVQEVGSARHFHDAHILKDRRTDSKSLDGKTLRNPSFKDFMPHIECLNLGGRHSPVDLTRTSEDMIPTEEGRDTYGVRRDIVIDEIQALLVKHYPSTSAAEKQKKQALLETHFHTASWTEVEKLMPLDDLKRNFNALHIELEKRPCRYFDHQAPLGNAPVKLDDSIPFLDEPAAAEAKAEPKAEATKEPETAAKPAAEEPEPKPTPAERKIVEKVVKTVIEDIVAEAPSEPDDRDIVVADLKRGLTRIHNGTRLAEFVRFNAADIDSLDSERQTIVKAAIDEAKGRISKAAASAKAKAAAA